ncbi:hypothetical protein B0H12DRAFT_1110926 [Mycena haematopus]|nr:hypothetical protein B0H12DRAFT_1110926 [Mycena haematopus]
MRTVISAYVQSCARRPRVSASLIPTTTSPTNARRLLGGCLLCHRLQHPTLAHIICSLISIHNLAQQLSVAIGMHAGCSNTHSQR